MKWFKRLLLLVAFLLLSALVFTGVGWHLMHGEPEWYQPRAMDRAQREQHAASAEDKFVHATNALKAFHAAERRNARANPTPAPVAPDPGPDPIELDITADELNAIFLKWAEFYNWEERYGDSLSDPMLHLHRGRLILAGNLVDLEAIVSLHYEPRMNDQGQLDMKLHRVMAGRLPLPQSLWNRGRDALTRSLQRRLPDLQQQARIAPDGSSNEQAMQAGFNRLLLHILNQEPGDPVIFIPLDSGERIPVRLSQIRIERQSLHVTLHPLTRDEREQFLQQIRQPYRLAAAKR